MQGPGLRTRDEASVFRTLEAAEICSGSEASSYLRLKDFVYHSTLGLKVIKKRISTSDALDPAFRVEGLGCKDEGRGFTVSCEGWRV